MPLYSFECPVGHFSERYLPLQKFREQQRCPCGKVARLVLSAPRRRGEFAPVVIHRRRDGHISFPAHAQAPLRPGYERVELRTLAEVRQLEREVNRSEFRKHVDHKEREELTFGSGRAARQAELRELARRMSPMGRDFAQAAMAATNAKSRSREAARFEAGFYVQAFSDDPGSMADYRDQSTGWKAHR